MTVKGSDLRDLLASSLPDPTLVLVEGRVEVVQVDDLDTDAYRGALLLVSRQELLGRGVREDSTDHELEQQAAAVSTAVNELGG
ncbi:hypothetical protein [Saccharothrix syringae]|uniref:Pyridine nucleotide-disulfide oxidoreductase n=1 Tax=Saccharothrix syringae TaxID=103733 RepID=A0A5Q0GT14_SACSY|nr:hypothetical protein [Saccharothrix syringae]QFZ17197.1 hypothetical protein EKG83_06720 [Saccharothrix syringae]